MRRFQPPAARNFHGVLDASDAVADYNRTGPSSYVYLRGYVAQLGIDSKMARVEADEARVKSRVI